MMKKWTVAWVSAGIVGGAILLAVIVLSISLAIGVWVPDILTRKKHTLAEMTTKDGYRFRVIQYWNQYDFYNTEFHITLPDGSLREHVIDGDDSKEWRATITANRDKGTVVVSFPGSGGRTFDWEEL